MQHHPHKRKHTLWRNTFIMNDAIIHEILRKAGIPDGRIKPLGGGKYNESHLVETGRDHFVLRIAPPDDVPQLFYEKRMMRSEPAVHQLMRNHTRVPVPEVVFHDFSQEILDRDYILLSFMEGEPGSFDDAELGRYTREMHEQIGSEFGYPDRIAPTGNSWPDIFNEYTRLIFEDCCSCGILSRQEKEYFLQIYDIHFQTIHDCRPRFLHLDLWFQNILTKNGKITAILDFDRGLYGDPELEFAVLDTYGYSTPDFFKGYGKPRPDDKNSRIRQKLYMAYELIKYAFIRYARNGNYETGRMHVRQCREILDIRLSA